MGLFWFTLWLEYIDLKSYCYHKVPTIHEREYSSNTFVWFTLLPAFIADSDHSLHWVSCLNAIALTPTCIDAAHQKTGAERRLE